MKREETTSQDQLIAELNALRQQLSALEERLDESKTAKRATVDNEAVVSDVSDYIGQQRSILEAAPEAIIAVDNGGRIVLANEQAQTLFGYDRDELLEKTVEMLIPERFHETHIQHRLGYQANPITRPMRERRRLAGRRKDGTEIPLKIGLSFTHLPSGEVDPDSMGSNGRLAIAMIAEAEASFISRGDDSGTNKKEISLWTDTDSDPNINKPAWYVESGQGMGATLVIASEKGAYTLTDRATYLANQDNLDLEILVEGDAVLLNVYHVMTVNPEKWDAVNYDGGLAFANFMIDPATQDVIREFGVDKFGQPLFFPDADKTDADLGL